MQNEMRVFLGLTVITDKVDWPFVIRGVLRRLFSTPLFIESLSDEEALIIELALDTIKIDFPSPRNYLQGTGRRKSLRKRPLQKTYGRRKAQEKGADEEEGVSQGDRSRVERRASVDRGGGGEYGGEPTPRYEPPSK
ncbi:hypothetical protein TIFTF001_013902 [Ficus carica]|uniref:Uncharacterized protein n=1 Tax=Ficus carica TaxID=3494 RepID=A0AA88D544_FICCA|nr:hypothetical protein TIFTF001_013902 [Ficus carica]